VRSLESGDWNQWAVNSDFKMRAKMKGKTFIKVSKVGGHHHSREEEIKRDLPEGTRGPSTRVLPITELGDQKS